MGNPVLVEAFRGGIVESRHCGAAAVVDADGGLMFARGDIEAPVFPRSAIKAMQAVPLVEGGGADRLGLSDEDLALCCASHSGEPRHVEGVRALLAKVGLGEGALACGVQWPLKGGAARALARAGGKPGAFHNNCSGKHAGMLCFACASGLPTEGYVQPGHGVQLAVRDALERTMGVSLARAPMGIDGCSIPAFAMPLKALAHGFARLATGIGLDTAHAAAGRRLAAAAMAHPMLVGGEGRFDSALMAAAPGAVFVKSGAEGVYCAASPKLGLGFAVKVDDGASRGAEIAMAALLARFGGLDEAKFAPFTRHVLANWAGVAVGEVAPAAALGDNA